MGGRKDFAMKQLLIMFLIGSIFIVARAAGQQRGETSHPVQKRAFTYE